MSRVSKFFLYLFGVLLLLIVCLHLIIRYRSKELVSKVVNELSGGRYVAETGNVSFQYFPAGISISELSVKPTSDTGKLFYIKSRQIELKLTSLVALLVDKKMGVSLLHVEDPEIVVKGKIDATDDKKTFPESIREIQNGLFKTFSLLKVNDASIQNGAIRLYLHPNPERYFAINHLNLDLKNIVLEPDADSDGIPEFEGTVTITLKNPDIHFANRSLELQMGLLEASSQKHSLVIDSMRFRYAKGKEQIDTINLERIKINQLNWKRFLKDGNMELDSVIVATGETTLNFYQANRQINADTISSGNGTYVGPNFLVHHLGISNVSYKLTVQEWIRSREDKMEVNFKGDSLWLKNLSITSNKKPAVNVDALRINFTNYSDANEQKTYTASLGAIEVSDNTLVLKNYNIQSLGGSNFSANNKVILPELRLQGYSLEDLFLKKLIAEKLVINKPEVVIDILQKKQKKEGPKKEINKEVKEFLVRFSKQVSLNEVEIKDASLILKPKKIKDDDIIISGLSMNVNARKALVADSVNGILQAVTKFSTEGFRIKSRDLDLVVSEMKMLKDRGLYFGTVQGKFGTNATVNLKGVTLLNRNFTFDVTSENGLHVSDLLVEGGTIDLTLNEAQPEKKAVMNLPGAIAANNVILNNIVFRVHKNGKVGVGSSLDVAAKNLKLENGGASWDKLFVNGNKNEAIIGDASFNAGRLTIEQPGSITLTNASGKLNFKNTHVNFETPKLLVDVNLSSTNIPTLKLERIVMQQPTIEIDVYQQELVTTNEKKATSEKNKDIRVQLLQMNDASIHFRLFKHNKEKLLQAKTINGTLQLSNLEIDADIQSQIIKIEHLNFETTKLETEIARNLFEPSSLNLKASKMVADLSKKTFSMHVDSFKLNNIAHIFYGKKEDTIALQFGELGMSDFQFSNKDSLKWKSILFNYNWWSKGGTLRYHSPNQLLAIDGLQLERSSRFSFSFDSMHMRPRKDREEFWRAEPYEKDHISLRLGKTSCDSMRLKIEEDIPNIAIHKLLVDNMVLIPQRDKTRPEDTLTYRPLLASQINAIPIPLQIDTLLLNNGKVVYHEIVKKTGLESEIMFDQMTGSLMNIKNHDIALHDSLIIAVRCRLYGKGALRMNFRQSYTDSLQGFRMQTRLGAFDLQEMNPMLLPQLGLRIISGDVDTLTMLVQGNKYFAYGTMDLRFQNFKVSLEGNPDSKKNILTGIKNWLANAVLRRHDKGKVNILFKQRVIKRGQFNFWGKIAIEGLLASIGIKNNRLESRSFQKQKKKYALPEEYMED